MSALDLAKGLLGKANPYAIYIKWGAIFAVALLAFFYVRGAEQAKADVITLSSDLDEAQANTRKNQEAFETCSAANEANRAEAERQRHLVMVAEARIEMMRRQADIKVEDINHEVGTFRSAGLECPALTDDFRQWVRGS